MAAPAPVPAPPAPLRIAVLETGTPMERAQAKYGGYGRVFEELFSAAAASLGWDPAATVAVTKYDVERQQQLPSRLDDVDAIAITGSAANAFDDTPWIVLLVDFVRRVLLDGDGRVRVVGVCFGHQIVARALGAPVRRGPCWEASVLPLPLTPAGRRLFEGRESINIYQMHRDVVAAVPAGTENLGATEHCAVQGLYQPRRLVTVQGHPEFNPELVDEILHVRRDKGIFTQAEFDDMMARVADPHDGVLIARAFLRFLLE